MELDRSALFTLFSNENSSLLLDGKWGIEKEAHRITAEGNVASTAHPAAFGSKLTNNRITTDFAESQLELATHPLPSIEQAFDDLIALQLYVEENLQGELLWPLSMPPSLPSEHDIPIASFGSSTEAKEREIYRKGLAYRYGKKMQMISGIHFNFSFGPKIMNILHKHFGSGQSLQAFRNDLYVALMRNFLRYRWLLIYLFGASPSYDHTYTPVITRELKRIASCCPELCAQIEQYKLYATSLRVSRFGYSSAEQIENGSFVDSLESYVQKLEHLVTTKSDTYSQYGTHQNGEQIQLNENILQKESELYSSIRLKQASEIGETEIEALRKRGVDYLEVRILDINPYTKVGVEIDQLYFLQAFMLFCLFEPSPYMNDDEWELVNRNHHFVSLLGRKPDLKLERYADGSITLKDWATTILKKMAPISSLMDQAKQGDKYQRSIENAHRKLMNPSLLPSGRIYNELKKRHEQHVDFGTRQAHKLMALKAERTAGGVLCD